jgi:hypothetical protein
MNYADNATIEEYYDITTGHDSNYNTEMNTPQTLFNGVPLSQDNLMEAITLLAQQLEEMRTLNALQAQAMATQAQKIATQDQEIAAIRAAT